MPSTPNANESKPIPVGFVRIVGKFTYQCLNCGDHFDKSFKHRTRLSRREANEDAIKQIVKDECGRYERIVCPECGASAPSVAGQKRKMWDLMLGVVGFFFSAFLSLAVLTPNTNTDVQWGIVSIAVVVFAGALITGTVIPTRLNPRDDSGVSYDVGKRWPAYVLYGVAIFFMLISPIRRTVSPLPRNNQCTPRVIVANQPIRIPVPCAVKTYGGHWSGVPTVQVVNASDFQVLPKIAATTHTEPNQVTIHTQTQEYAFTPDTYVDVTLPDDPQLMYRPVHVRVYLTLNYPMPVSETTYLYNSTQLQHEVVLTMVPQAAARTEIAIGAIGAFLGVIALGAGAFWLNRVDGQLARIHFPRKVHLDEIESREPRD